jgi:hypothetical protein
MSTACIQRSVSSGSSVTSTCIRSAAVARPRPARRRCRWMVSGWLTTEVKTPLSNI